MSVGNYRWVTCGGCLSDTQDSSQNLILTSIAYKNRPRMLLLFYNLPLNNIQVFFVLNSASSQKWKRKNSHGIVLRYTHSHHPVASFCLSPRGKKGIPPSPNAHFKKKLKLKNKKKKKKRKENYLSWQDSTFRVSSTFKSYLLSVTFVASCFFKQASEAWQSRSV